VLVDGDAVGTAPLARPVYVEARRHVVAAELRGQRSAEVIVLPSAGTRGVVELTLDAAPSSPTAGAAGPSPAAPEPTHEGGLDAARPWLAVASGSLLAAGLATGIGFTIASNAHADDADSLAASLPPGGCASGGTARACVEIGGNIGLSDGQATTAVVGYVLAGVGAIALATVLLVPAGDDAEIAVGPGGAQARLRFR
jgi:hypothetical protein